ncbi:LamG domain-containing protein [Candidatus Pacearchaeota archaeon]|nr:LamG domain-containing protein [Candidatus Pacearchaeota archaeon]
MRKRLTFLLAVIMLVFAIFLFPYVMSLITSFIITTTTLQANDSLPTNVSNISNNQFISISTSPPYDSLQAYWSFDAETTNASAFDFSLNSYNLTYQANATLNKTTCFIAQCLGNNGFGIPLSAINASNLNITSALTISLWVYANSTGQNGGFIDRATSGSTNIQYSLFYEGSSLFFRLINKSNSISNVIVSQPSAGIWHHIVATYNGTSNRTIYVDNVVQAPLGGSAADGTVVDSLSGQGDRIILGSLSGAYPFSGMIDEVMIFNTSLTAAQVQDIFNNQSVRFKSRGIIDFKAQNLIASNSNLLITKQMDKVNVTLSPFVRSFGTNISVQLGYWNQTLGYNDTGMDGLVAYYHLDQNGSDFSGNGNHGLLTSSVYVDFTNNSYYGGGIASIGLVTSGATFNVVNFSSNPSNYTWAFWIRHSSASVHGVLMAGGWPGLVQPAHGKGYSITIGQTGNADKKLHFTTHRGDSFNSTAILNDDQWYHVVVTYLNESTPRLLMYINGVLDSTQNTNRIEYNSSYNIQYVANAVDTSTGNVTVSLTGDMDELMIFNRSLNTSEIKDLYIKGRSNWTYVEQNFSNITGNDSYSSAIFGIPLATTNIRASLGLSPGAGFYTPILRNAILNMNISNNDSISPYSIILNAPGDGENLSYTNVTFNFTVLDNYDLGINCTLIVNSTTRAVNLTVRNNTFTNLNVSTVLRNATYQWNITCTDSNGNRNVSVTRRVTLDNGLPNSSLLSPTNNSYVANLTINFTANLTDNLAGLKNATLYLFNSSNSLINQTDIFFTSGGVLQQVVGVVVTVVEGVYKWFYRIVDWSGNPFSTRNNTVTVDVTVPLISYGTGVENNGENVSHAWIYVNLSLTESNIANITFTLSNATEVVNMSNYTVSTLEINLTGLPEALYTYNVTIIDKAGNYNATPTRTLYIDLTPPAVSGIVYYPNSTNDVDPGENITFNATITDNRVSVSAVILQIHNGTGWLNRSMSVYSGSLYQGNVTLIPEAANYTFNLLANDSLGNTNVTSNFTFASEWDCTWNATPSDLGPSVGWSQNKLIGMIDINNTGDAAYSNNNCTLDFRLTYDLTEGRIYFDQESFRPSNTKTITARTNKTILVNASFVNEVRQEAVVVNITELGGRSTTSQKNVTATVVSNQNSPYLFQAITSSPTVVYLTPSNFSLVGYVRNLMGAALPNASLTAVNVSFNWSLPSGLTNISGILQLNFTNLSDNLPRTNQINVSLSNLASFTPGIKTVTLYAYGYNGSGNSIQSASGSSLLSETASINFLCYNISDGILVSDCGSLDGDFVAPSTTITVTGGSNGGGGGGGGGAAAVIKSEATFELVRGRDQSFSFEVKNKYSQPFEHVRISVTGLNSKYVELIPAEIQRIAPFSSTNITVKISAPAYFSQGEHILFFAITGDIISNASTISITEQRVITLKVLEVSTGDADKLVSNMQSYISLMNSSHMNVQHVSSLLHQAESLRRDFKFVELRKIYDDVKKLYDDALESQATIAQLKEGVAQAEHEGLGVLETKKVLYLAEVAFGRGDYTLALERINEAKLTYALEVKGEFNLIFTVKNHPFRTVGVLLSVALLSLGSTILIRLRLYKRKLIVLEEEEKLLIGLMKVVQRECFERKTMSMEEYDEAMRQYELKLGEVIEEKIRVETQIASIMKIRGKRRALSEERRRLVELIKKTQDDYLNQGKFETRIYENMLKTYATRLTEVEEQLVFLDASDALKSQGFGKAFGRKS